MCWAQCLETGSVVSADNANKARSMIMELIKDEVRRAQDNSSLGNLFNTPAPLGIWQTYYEWSQYSKILGRGVHIVSLKRAKPSGAGRGDTSDSKSVRS